jgi:hypothetical protein
MPINYSEYPDNWKTEIRPFVLKRANNCCEGCGVENYSIIKREKNGLFRVICKEEHDMILSKVKYSGYTMSGAIKKLGFTKIVLTIAHLDHDKFNKDVNLDRLRAWCQKCHLGYDMKHHVENRKYSVNHKNNNYKFDF